MNRTHATWLAGVLALAIAIVLVPRKPPAPAVVNPAHELPTVQNSGSRPAENRGTPPPRRPSSTTRKILSELPKPADVPEENAPWIADRISELDRLSWFNDAESLRTILSEMRSSSPEIRAAALSATKAFSSRDSIPYLEALAAETRDPKEQKDITDAIEYLKLPTLVEELDKQQEPPPEEPTAEDAPAH